MRADDWQIEDEKEVISTHIGKVLSAEVTCPQGISATFYRFVFADWVNVVAETENGDLLCIRQFRFGTRRVEFEIPGGAIERGEDPVAAGVRELLEETGYQGSNAQIIGVVSPNPALQQNRCYTVFVEQVRQVGPQHLDEMEEIEVFTLPLEKVEEMIDRGEIPHGLVLNALMFYLRKRR